MKQPHTVAAFVVCDHDKGINYTAVMESYGPAVVDRIVRKGLDEGQLTEWAGRGVQQATEAVLDVLADDDDIIRDYCIPHSWAFEWWQRAVELRATSSDCRECEPAAYDAIDHLRGPRRG